MMLLRALNRSAPRSRRRHLILYLLKLGSTVRRLVLLLVRPSVAWR